MKRLVLLAVACATAVVLSVAAAGAAQNGSGGPLAKSAAVTTRHIPLSKAGGAMPRGLDLKGVPSKGSYAFLLKLKAEPTGVAYNAFRNVGKSAARTAAVNQLATVQAAQRSVIAALPSGTHVLYETHAALAGVAVYTKVTNVSALQRISGVANIYPIAPKKPSLSYAVHLVKAPEVWATSDPGSLGENSTVAIIDTGIDYTHADFGGSGDPADYQTAFANDTIAPTPGSFDPTKVVGGNVGHDFAGDAYDADDPNSVPVPDNNPLDCNSHGTHVAGIVAGYGENPDGSTFTGDYTTLGGLSSSAYQALFRIGPGMAPKAKIISYKVFGCEGSTNVVGAALDRAADPNNDGDTSDHVDVVNMSLGSDFGSPQDGDSVLSNADSELGISVVIAAGNGGDLYDIGGSPGNATRAIGVAASVDAYNQIDTLHATVNGTAHDYGAQRSVAYDWANDPDLSAGAEQPDPPHRRDHHPARQPRAGGCGGEERRIRHLGLEGHRVFDGERAAMDALEDGTITAGDVVVIRYEGPKGRPGMREMRITGAIKGAGLGKDVMLITDSQFSGGTTGLCVGHIAPEATEGGPIALVADGDPIILDVANGTLDLGVDDAELARRRETWTPAERPKRRGVLAKYSKLVKSANVGAVCN